MIFSQVSILVRRPLGRTSGAGELKINYLGGLINVGLISRPLIEHDETSASISDTYFPAKML